MRLLLSITTQDVGLLMYLPGLPVVLSYLKYLEFSIESTFILLLILFSCFSFFIHIRIHLLLNAVIPQLVRGLLFSLCFQCQNLPNRLRMIFFKEALRFSSFEEQQQQSQNLNHLKYLLIFLFPKQKKQFSHS